MKTNKQVDWLYGAIGKLRGLFCEHLKQNWTGECYVNTWRGYTIMACEHCMSNHGLILNLLQSILANKAEFDRYISEARPGDSEGLPVKVLTATAPPFIEIDGQRIDGGKPQ